MITDGTALQILGGIATIAGSVPYAIAAWRGKERPSWVSYSVWSGTTGLSTLTTLAAGSTVAAFVPAAAFLRCMMLVAAIVVGTFRYREGRAPTTRLEWGCLIGCAVTASIWVTSMIVGIGDPVTNAKLVLIAALATDFIASLPVWRQVWNGGESWVSWAGALANASATVFVLAVIKDGRSLSDWASPGYEFVLCSTLTTLILIRQGKLRWPGKTSDDAKTQPQVQPVSEGQVQPTIINNINNFVTIIVTPSLRSAYALKPDTVRIIGRIAMYDEVILIGIKNQE